MFRYYSGSFLYMLKDNLAFFAVRRPDQIFDPSVMLRFRKLISDGCSLSPVRQMRNSIRHTNLFSTLLQKVRRSTSTSKPTRGLTYEEKITKVPNCTQPFSSFHEGCIIIIGLRPENKKNIPLISPCLFPSKIVTCVNHLFFLGQCHIT